jgi:hypothetical protein
MAWGAFFRKLSAHACDLAKREGKDLVYVGKPGQASRTR